MKPIYTKDYAFTKEDFTILFDENNQCLKTTPQPDKLAIEKYYQSEDYISHTDSKKNTIEKLYHFVRTYSLKRKYKLIAKNYKAKGCILDVGCGTGDFLQTMQRYGWDVTGFEPSTKAAKIAKSKDINLMNDLSYIPDHYFDVITMWHVLEHVHDLEKQIQELKRLLKPNGLLLVAVPNYKSLDSQYYGTYWAAFDAPRHLWHFSKKSITHLFGRVGMQVIKIKPMYFDSFYVSLLSEKYKSKYINYVVAFGVGLLSNINGWLTKEYSSHIYLIKNK